MAGRTQTLPPSFSQEPVSPPPLPQLPRPSSTQFLVPWPSSQMSLSSGTPKGIPVSLPSHIPARRDMSCHPSYLSCWPQTRGAVSVLAATGPRRGSPILHLGPGHTSWGCGGNPGCGGRVVRRHLWLQKCVWGSKVGGQGIGGTVRKIRMAVPPEWPNAM